MTTYFALQYARCCVDLACQAVWDMRLSRTCPGCGFALSLPISRYLNKPAKPVEPPPVRKEKRA